MIRSCTCKRHCSRWLNRLYPNCNHFLTLDSLHIIVISSVRPELTSAGQIILYRHLVNQPGITLDVYGGEIGQVSIPILLRRFVGRLGRTRWRQFSEDFWALWNGRWLDSVLPKKIENPKRTVVLTVAHGDGSGAAIRFAKQHQLPLVTFFHDWYPDIPPVHHPLRRRLIQSFRRLYVDSDVALCVSEGMREALGPHLNAVVLPPVPAHGPENRSVPRPRGSSAFRVIYSGNLRDYGPMLGDALEASLDESDLHLQVRGSDPVWPEDRRIRMKENGRWLEFAPRQELEAWLATADAFLIPMVFAPAMRRRMETSFPSKLIEFAQFGKPLVIWGPEYCSAVRWARRGDKALTVSDADPKIVVRQILGLLGNPDAIERYSLAASRSAAAEFNHEHIQRDFRNSLQKVLGLV